MSNTILIADDDTELCELLREYFALEGFEVNLILPQRQTSSGA